jgi:hypothetical protein
MKNTDLSAVLVEQLKYIEASDYAGYDPYDALNSPLLKLLSIKSKWARIAFTQVVRRLPINLRPALGVRKAHNPKGLGLFLEGYAKLYAVENNAEHLERISHLLDLLERSKSRGFSGNCWGYNFDWQSRSAYRPRFTPTIVNTSFIVHALIDTYRLTGNERALDMAIKSIEFFLHDLNRKVEDDLFCFSYTPIDHDYVHNANVLGASALIRLYGLTGDEKLRETACASTAYCMRYQREDGSWPFAETSAQRWVDSFHTGFILEALRYFVRSEKCHDWNGDYHRGVRYYADNFFLSDGTPKYYSDRVYPIDVHAAAEAICFFSGEGSRYRYLADRILSWLFENMYSGKGYFYFRKSRVGINSISYMRWSQAWCFRALVEYFFSTANRFCGDEGR